MTRQEVAHLIDHSQLRAYATQEDISRLCEEAIACDFHAVAVNPGWTAFCAKRLSSYGIGVCACVAFPLGANTAHVKVEEARDAVRLGATEIDMVINIGALKSGYPGYVEREIAAVVKAVRGTPVKVILETSYLSTEEKIAVCKMAGRAGAAFVKTSTGYGDAGATVDDVALMNEVVAGRMGIKAAGGIRNYGDFLALYEAGATRFGTSAGLEILEDADDADREEAYDD